MEILSVFDPLFKEYGQVLTGYDTAELLKVLTDVSPLPEGTAYVPDQPELSALPVQKEFRDNAYGGMPIQIGWCNGHNTKLNCLEYHRDSEINIGANDFILLLARRADIGDDGMLDTSKVKAFRAPAGAVVEVYATTLHYAPCNAKAGQGFRVIVILPWDTNTAAPEIAVKNDEDRILRARNKWLLAHADSNEAKSGAPVRLTGENIDIAAFI